MLGNKLKKAQESTRVCDSIFEQKSCENTRAKMIQCEKAKWKACDEMRENNYRNRVRNNILCWQHYRARIQNNIVCIILLLFFPASVF